MSKKKNPLPKWEPWMGEEAKADYERGKPEPFKRTMWPNKKLRKNDVVMGEGAKLYRILEIKEIEHNGFFVEVQGRWQELSRIEAIYCDDEKINYGVF